MLGYYEKKFWENFKKQNLAPIEFLIQNEYDVAAAKLICSVIDSLAGFYVGRIKPGKIRESFVDFLKKYMPVFFNLNFEEKFYFRKNKKVVKNAANILYCSFRNGLIHGRSLGLGVEIYRDEDIKILWKGFGIKIMQLNILGFWEYFKKALKDYESDLEKDRNIFEKFRMKYFEIQQPIFELKQ
ncbi:MAG: hypothetical protein U9R23_05160 [Candidatus Cloacimonadota bacterium]|nr:hypothetical protein [Candidatus Cloacimonadota bacterium]